MLLRALRARVATMRGSRRRAADRDDAPTTPELRWFGAATSRDWHAIVRLCVLGPGEPRLPGWWVDEERSARTVALYVAKSWSSSPPTLGGWPGWRRMTEQASRVMRYL